MERRRFLEIIGGFGVVGLAGGADHRRHRMQARCLRDLPGYDYRTGDGIGKVGAISNTSLPLQAGATQPHSKFYQWQTQAVVFGHCSLSKIAVTLVSDGTWIVSFRAEQNPLFPVENQQIIPQVLDGKGGSSLYTNHLKRNTFRVTFEGYGFYPTEEPNPDIAPGKPALVRFNLAPFVVERATPLDRRIVSTVADADVKRFYDQIDRFGVEFTYE